MGVGKVLGGVAAGVGVIALSPFFGAVGAIGLAGAAVGAVAGGVGGALASENEKNKKIEAERRSRLEGAEAQRKLDDEKIKEVQAKAEAELLALKKELSMDAYNDHICALYALGYAISGADGNISEGEISAMDLLINSFSEAVMPPILKISIGVIKKYAIEHRFSFNDAMKYVEKAVNKDLSLDIKNKLWTDYKEFLETIMGADKVVEETEKAFIVAFMQTKDRYIKE